MDELPWSTRPTPDRSGDRPVGEHLVRPEPLTRMAVAVLTAAGAPERNAGAVAASLVAADLAGHDSHGVRRLVPYVGAIRAGTLDPAAQPRVARSEGAGATVDGRGGFGQLAAALATREVRELARAHGVGVVAISRGNHIGRLSEYVEALAEAGLVGIAFCNADPTVAPHGGRDRLLGTNPLAWAVPRGPGESAVVIDFATAAVAEGKLALSAARGEHVPPGLLVDGDGRDSTDPADFYEGGALLPFGGAAGGHKGYGLSVMIEIVGGLLSGAGISSLPGYDGTNGSVLLAVDIAAFLPADRFREQTERFCRRLSASTPAHEDRSVLVPGELEARTRAHRLQHGIPLSTATWNELAALPGFALPEGDST
ncbi:Ldh family oxidoreductase [Glycomyces tenuis]|uniref:Ldh family oxidoreductase n=1 Tax=Glycomyces tenuis TaxID=58116 RepID=UPI0003F6DD00|nr:Ldh family oxidoreductase [Glycomyces tenuis]